MRTARNKGQMRSLQESLKTIRISIVSLMAVLVIVFAGMLFWSSSVNMHMLAGYQDLQDYYNSISEGTDAVRDYLINENGTDLGSYESAIERARRSVHRLEQNPYLQQKWRFELLENMIDSYDESALALEKQYRSELKAMAYRSFYDQFLMQDELIQNTSVSYYHQLTESMTAVQKMYGVIRTICLLLAGIAAILLMLLVASLDRFFKQDLSRPLKEISENIGNIRQGQYSLSVTQAGSEEMQEVYQALKEMAERISHSMEVEKQNLTLEKKLAESRLKMLQNQINPHFLFNTLNTIYCLCEDGNSEQAGEMIFKTSHLLRYSLENQNRISTLGQELQALQDYVEIQQMRRKNWIDFTLSADSDPLLMELPVPPMILQPLVENSISHGLKDRTGTGTIVLSVRSEDGQIVIEIYDDGRGVSSQRLEELQNLQSENPETGLGLFNVLHRMEVFYRDRFAYALKSEEGKYFLVQMRIRKERGA